MNQILQKLQSANLMDMAGNIILVKYEDSSYQAVDVATFEQYFGSVVNGNPADLHAALVAADNGKGYTQFFDSWKTQGIL